jgi:hypothetical protein
LRHWSGENIANDPAVDIGQAEVAARVAVGEPGVVQPHQMQDRRVQVVHVNGVFGDLVAVFVRATVAETPFNSAAGEEAGQTMA